jgi:FkbM family methyltransferase
MNLVTRIKRVIKEVLGRAQHPRSVRNRALSLEHQIYECIVGVSNVVFDIGANVGEISLYIARLVGPGGSVIAFEPVWPTYVRLCQQVQADYTLRAPIIPINVGISDVEGTASINVPAGDFGQGSLAPLREWKDAQVASSITPYQCRFVFLDKLMRSTGMAPPDVVKIDVEGAELLVLRSMTELLSSARKPLLFIELYAPWQRALGLEPWEPLWLLQSHGYEFLFVCPGGVVAHMPTREVPCPPAYLNGYNIVAFSRNRHANVILSLEEHLQAGSVLSFPPPQFPNR